MADGTGEKWDDKEDVIHGTLDSGRKVTVKFTKDGNEALVARGHVEDIQKDVDHSHHWNQKAGTPDHHDKRLGNKIFTGQADKFDAIREGKDALIARALALSTSTNWRESSDEFRSLTDQWKALGPGKPATDNAQYGQFSSAKSKFFDAKKEDGDRRARGWAEALRVKERLISSAESLASSSDFRVAGESMRKLTDEWKTAPRGRKEDEDRLWDRFSTAKAKFFDARRTEFERRERVSAEAVRVKERLISSAESLAYSADLRAAGDAMRKLGDEWKSAPRANRDDEEKLWTRFNAAKTKLNGRRDDERKKRESEETRAKSEKQSIISSARSASHLSDTRAARDEMRRLQDRWKAAGRASRSDEDLLYKEFKATQDALFQRVKAESAKREEEQRAAVRAKEHIIAQIKALAGSNDLRAATDQVKALSDQYFAAGSAGRENNDRLKASFQSAKTAFFDAKKRESEKKKAEWEASKRTRISEMEQRIREMESRVAQARYQLSDAWAQLSQTRSRPQPSWSNPHRSDIVARQYEREQRTQQRINQIETRIYSMEAKITTMNTKLSQLRSR